MRELSLYVHIPFCVRKCLYCDFLSFSVADKREKIKSYVNLLAKEIRMWGEACKDRTVVSIFFGGGTPSLLDENEMKLLMEQIRENFALTKDAEITMEMNPGTVSLESLVAYRKAGINRISIGLQSARDEELKAIGRIHTYAEFQDSFAWARQAGFENINIDLMAALPGQDIASYRSTLEKAVAFSPEHISSYSLILEEGTFLYDRQEDYRFPTEDEEREMYDLTEEILQNAGYHRYEISNYAKDGYECRHNKVYWRRGDYLGLGLGASSMMENWRWKNPSEPEKYRRYVEGKEPLKGISMQTLTVQEQMEEFMFLGLRLTAGISAREFAVCFGTDIESVYGEVLERHYLQKTMQKSGDRIWLTKRGMDVSNYVMADFLFDT